MAEGGSHADNLARTGAAPRLHWPQTGEGGAWTQKVSFTAPWNTRAPYEVRVDVIWPKVDETNDELDPRLPLLPGAANAG
jgi:hypothetical protein